MAENGFAEPMIQATLALFAGLALQTIVDGDRQGQHAAVRELFKQIDASMVVKGFLKHSSSLRRRVRGSGSRSSRWWQTSEGSLADGEDRLLSGHPFVRVDRLKRVLERRVADRSQDNPLVSGTSRAIPSLQANGDSVNDAWV
jgi:hypothetical protein